MEGNLCLLCILAGMHGLQMQMVSLPAAAEHLLAPWETNHAMTRHSAAGNNSYDSMCYCVVLKRNSNSIVTGRISLPCSADAWAT